MTSQPPEQSTAHYDFAGRVALVPGGLGGAGRAVTLAFLSAGAQVVAVEHQSHSAKNAVLTLVEVQAEELRDTHITVNAILPSIIDTPANRTGMPSSDFSRWPKPEEVARVLLFLASDDAGLISGAAIPVYGRA
jgi:NAD(P)-dependent dehydrogenase (short-subunit alcohol dehydrogenase family)